MTEQAQVGVNGLLLPRPLSGHVALEFCNTLAGWNGPPVREYLIDYEHLVTWSTSIGLLGGERAAGLVARASTDPAAAMATLDRAIAMRACLHEALLRPDASGAVAAFASGLRHATRYVSLGIDGGQPQWQIDEGAGLSAPVLAAVWSGAQLLVSPELRQVTACPGHGCGWLFLNPSGRRRWCLMATCGNRAKARRFFERHQGGGDGAAGQLDDCRTRHQRRA